MKLTSYKIDRSARQWYLLDAADVVLGRLSSQAATILMGKHKPGYTPIFDSGDYVVIVNAAKAKVTGFKLQQKEYHHHTGYVGNMKSATLQDLMNKTPDKVIFESIRKMLPKSLLGKKMIKKLRVYKSDKHPHQNVKFINL
ncbi:MAG TPA: 50S ribosomal protein L13 [bacterium]|nr:50S ribosomal protein L13 [bacterium]HPN67526.1 50S ribosomal protein L13 [bacterium]